MAKNIALFIDGTWNEPDGDDEITNTNVYKLYTAATQNETQRTHYRKGIGTKRWRGIRRVLTNSFEGAFGLGMSASIKDVYRFLSNEYERSDNIYLFGFSRGAFAARSLAGFAEAVGLLFRRDPDDNHLEEAYALYENDDKPGHGAVRDFLRSLQFPAAPNREDGTDLPIYFLGVWDTVGALGLTGRWHAFSAPFTEYHKTELPSNVTHARHALALHELRKDFAPLLWNSGPPTRGDQTLQQMWFAGAHSDVGGGYEEHGYWADAALSWMASEASTLGLQLSKTFPGSAAPRDPTINNSISGFFAGDPLVVRRSLYDPDKEYSQACDSFCVHESALQRLLLDRTLSYRAVTTVVEAAWNEVDDLTIRMHADHEFRDADVSLAADPERHEWWKEHSRARVLAQARTDLESFITTSHQVTADEAEHIALTLALFVLCGGGAALDEIGSAVESQSQRRWSQSRPQQSELAALEIWIARLRTFKKGLDSAARMLPDKAQEPIADWQRRMHDVQQSLQSTLHEARLRATRDATRTENALVPPSARKSADQKRE